MACDAVARKPPDAPWLFFAELIHRVGNEYASCIAAASTRATRSSHPETRTALKEVATRLQAYAGVHQLLQPPVEAGSIELSGYLTRLCLALGRARLQDHGIRLVLSLNDPLPVPAGCGWRVALVVSELVTNAARHAFLAEGGVITVTLARHGEEIACQVADSGTSSRTGAAGRGTRLIDALVEEIGGTVERRFSPAGSAVTVVVPATSPAFSGDAPALPRCHTI